MYYTIDKTRKEYSYAEKIISGEYLSDEPELLACKRFMKDLNRQNGSSKRKVGCRQKAILLEEGGRLWTKPNDGIGLPIAMCMEEKNSWERT